MRSKGNGGIGSVLRTADHDHARDRILCTQFWRPSTPTGGELVALETHRAMRAALSR